jgi:hypothetical protein
MWKRTAWCAALVVAALAVAGEPPTSARPAQRRDARQADYLRRAEALRPLALSAKSSPLRIQNQPDAPFMIAEAKLARIAAADYERVAGLRVAENQVLDGHVLVPVVKIRNEGAVPIRGVVVAIVDVETINLVVGLKLDPPLGVGESTELVGPDPIYNPAGYESRCTTARSQGARFETGSWELEKGEVSVLHPRPRPE